MAVPFWASAARVAVLLEGVRAGLFVVLVFFAETTAGVGD